MIFFASCSANQNDIVAEEAKQAGSPEIRVSVGGVEFSADMETAYKFCLWTKAATRLLVLVYRAEMTDLDEMFEKASALPWENWLGLETTFSISETVSGCNWIRNSHFAALRLKDAIVERMRAVTDGERPNVNKEDPDVVFHLHVNRDKVSFYIDFGGKQLSRRGYRQHQTTAVLGEFTASAVIQRSPWLKRPGIPLLDPFCGSGTICIEAALDSANIAPGLVNPDRFAFYKLPIHNEELWSKVLNEAEEQRKEPEEKIYGWDIDPKAIEIAKKNASAAGVDKYIEFSVKDFLQVKPEDCPAPKGCIVTDPPYGIRLEATPSSLMRLYQKTGEVFIESFKGWTISVLCGQQELLSFMDLKPNRTNSIINGGIECQIAHYYVFSEEERAEMADKAIKKKEERLSAPLSDGAQMAYNRLVKNLADIKPKMEERGITSYRIYDADMPEYSAAIDFYENQWICLQEYVAPSTIDPADAQRRLQELIYATERAVGIDIEKIFVKQREIQSGDFQYQRKKTGMDSKSYVAHENGHAFIVNFTDYLDTGIFLDHRPARKMIQEKSKDKRFLNLFCYTGTATVYAAAGGALSTVSVDTSSTYLEWAQKNMEINSFRGMNHFFYKDDCRNWLSNSYDKFDLIFCDPPTFSNGTGRDSFDVYRDQDTLIDSCMYHFEKEGELIFSTNNTRFKISEYLEEKYEVKNITDQTIDTDFARHTKIHYCFSITHKNLTVKKEVKTTTKTVKKVIKRS